MPSSDEMVNTIKQMAHKLRQLHRAQIGLGLVGIGQVAELIVKVTGRDVIDIPITGKYHVASDEPSLIESKAGQDLLRRILQDPSIPEAEGLLILYFYNEFDHTITFVQCRR